MANTQPGPAPQSVERSLTSPDRYARQSLFAGIGLEGQQRIDRARVLIVGCGALGTSLASYLVRAGTGYVRIVDRDFVEGNNLQRQVLFAEDDVRRRMPKAIAAANYLRTVNSQVTVDPIVADVTADGIMNLLEDVDLVLDGTDNFEIRYVLNDACIKNGTPWIYSGVIASYGVTMTVVPHDTACLRCVFPERPLPGTTPTCDTAGVLNSIVGIVAGLAATEAFKLMTRSDRIVRGLTWVDVWENTFDRIELPRQTECPACGRGEFAFLDAPVDSSGTTLCGRDAVQVHAPPGHAGLIDLAQLGERLQAVGTVRSNPYLLQLAVDNFDITLFADGRAIIKGTADPAVARTLYARYIGS